MTFIVRTVATSEAPYPGMKYVIRVGCVHDASDFLVQ